MVEVSVFMAPHVLNPLKSRDYGPAASRPVAFGPRSERSPVPSVGPRCKRLSRRRSDGTSEIAEELEMGGPRGPEGGSHTTLPLSFRSWPDAQRAQGSRVARIIAVQELP